MEEGSVKVFFPLPSGGEESCCRPSSQHSSADWWSSSELCRSPTARKQMLGSHSNIYAIYQKGPFQSSCESTNSSQEE